MCAVGGERGSPILLECNFCTPLFRSLELCYASRMLHSRPVHLVKRMTTSPYLGEMVRVVFRFSSNQGGYGGWNDDGTRGGDEFEYGFEIKASTAPIVTTRSEARELSGAGTRIEGARKFYFDCDDLARAVASTMDGSISEVQMQANYDAAVELLDAMIAKVAAYLVDARAIIAAAQSPPIQQRQIDSATSRIGTSETNLATARELRAALPADIPDDQIAPTIFWVTDGVSALFNRYPDFASSDASLASYAASLASYAASLASYAASLASFASQQVLESRDDPAYVRARNFRSELSDDLQQIQLNRFELGSIFRRGFPDWRAEIMNADIEYDGDLHTVHSINEYGQYCVVFATRKS